MTTKQFIEKAKEVHGDKYDYSLVDYKNSKTKVKIICPIHGVFEQTPYHHYNRKQGCPICANFSRREKKQSSVEEFIKAAQKVHGDKYDYSLVDYKNNKTKIKIICPTHGAFEQRPDNHLMGKGCLNCMASKGGRRKTIEEFLQSAKEIHGDKYDYSLVDYKNAFTKIKIICPVHGIFEITPDAFINQKQGCSSCQESKGERSIFNFLIKNGFIINETFFRQKSFEDLFVKNKSFLLRYDFYIPSKKLLIEYNGEQHYNNIKVFYKSYHDFLMRKHYDWLKRKYARDNGYKLLTIPYWNYKIINKILKENLEEII